MDLLSISKQLSRIAHALRKALRRHQPANKSFVLVKPFDIRHN